MDRETYPKKWGMGPYALKKKKLVTEGKLDKYGNPNENTPKDYLKIFGGDAKKETKTEEVPAVVETTVSRIFKQKFFFKFYYNSNMFKISFSFLNKIN